MNTHIFLIGMMGCGKSTVGRRLAQLLRVPFVDLDEDIEAHACRTIPEIFAESGDAGFRICETAALRRVLLLPPCVVATGGGIVTREENIALMRARGWVVWLNRPLEDILLTVRQDTRPNLAGDKEERMRTLFAQRQALYERAAHMTFSNHLPPKDSVPQLRALLEKNKRI